MGSHQLGVGTYPSAKGRWHWWAWQRWWCWGGITDERRQQCTNEDQRDTHGLLCTVLVCLKHNATMMTTQSIEVMLRVL